MSWRKCPFEVGKQYLVLKDITHLNHHFIKGTIVIFKAEGYDFRAGVTRFWFYDLAGSEIGDNAWHVFDSDPEPSETWQMLFKQG